MSSLKFSGVRPRETPRNLEKNLMNRLYSPIEHSPPISDLQTLRNDNSPKKLSSMNLTVSIDGITERKIRFAIVNALEHYMYDSAIFLAERLYAYCSSDENLLLMTTCYYRNNELTRVYHMLKTKLRTKMTNPIAEQTSSEISLRYLFSRTAYSLHKLSDADTCLLPVVDYILKNELVFTEKNINERFHIDNMMTKLSRNPMGLLINGDHPIEISYTSFPANFGLDPSAILCLAGMINRRLNKNALAETYLKTALKLNPWMWYAYETLCDMGCDVPGESFFSLTGLFLSSSSINVSSEMTPVDDLNSSIPPSSFGDSLFPSSPAPQNIVPFVSRANPLESDTYSSPSLSSFHEIPSKRTRILNTLVKDLNKSHQLMETPAALNTRGQRLVDLELNLKHSDFLSKEVISLRRSTRLLSLDKKKGSTSHRRESNKKIRTAGLKFFEQKKQLDSKTSSNEMICSACELEFSDDKKDEDYSGLGSFFMLLGRMADIYRLISLYKCKEAIELIMNLPESQIRTGWVTMLLAKSHIELHNFHEAERLFDKLRVLEPYRLRGMEIYSSFLWHIRKDTNLSSLAHELLKFDKTSPEPWCAMGNCFSLQQEPESAVKCFQRAVDLNSMCFYAHTLCGYEYTVLEDHEKAQTCFRNALKIEIRDYKAWYGLGMVYLKQEKFTMAEYHFRRALEINPRSPLLHCFVGMVLNARNESKDAFTWFTKAAQLAPEDPFIRFKLARAYVLIGQYEEALTELNRLKDDLPKESAVHFLIAHVYKQLGEKHKTVMHMTWAYDLDPRGPHALHDTFEKNSMYEDDFLPSMMEQKSRDSHQ